jgi:uncharacterized protein
MENYTSFESSNVARISYDVNTNLLEVEFHKSGIYQYFDVPNVVWEEFKAAASKGEYLAQFIKGSYRYSRI